MSSSSASREGFGVRTGARQSSSAVSSRASAKPSGGVRPGPNAGASLTATYSAASSHHQDG